MKAGIWRGTIVKIDALGRIFVTVNAINDGFPVLGPCLALDSAQNLQVGDAVLVDFFQGNLGKPVIMGTMGVNGSNLPGGGQSPFSPLRQATQQGTGLIVTSGQVVQVANYFGQSDTSENTKSTSLLAVGFTGSFTKMYAGTKLIFDCKETNYTNPGGNASYGLFVNSVAYTAVQFYWNTALQHQTVTWQQTITGIAAGTVSTELGVATDGTCEWLINTMDSFGYMVYEVW